MNISRTIKSGFTLIELLVVLVIMSVLTIAFLENQAKFDSSTIQRSLAYSIALSVRQAQVNGTSVRGTPSGGATIFTASHGVFFAPNTVPSYVLFADTLADNYYTKQDDTTEQTFTINSEYAISEVCTVSSAGIIRCSGSDVTGSVAYGSGFKVTVMFTRPNPDAHIYAYNGTSPAVSGETYSSAYIKLSSVNSGDYRFISVSSTGLVTVCAANTTIGANC